jgi:hypothetical protein
LHYDSDRLRGRVYFAIERFLERWTDSLVFVSDYERRTYNSKIGPPRVPWRLIHNGLRAHEFEPVDTVPDAADFLYIGMMRDLKGTGCLHRSTAAGRTDLAGPRYAASWLATATIKPRYQARIDMLGLGDPVENAGCHACTQGFRVSRALWSFPRVLNRCPTSFLKRSRLAGR